MSKIKIIECVEWRKQSVNASCKPCSESSAEVSDFGPAARNGDQTVERT